MCVTSNPASLPRGIYSTDALAAPGGGGLGGDPAGARAELRASWPTAVPLGALLRGTPVTTPALSKGQPRTRQAELPAQSHRASSCGSRSQGQLVQGGPPALRRKAPRGLPWAQRIRRHVPGVCVPSLVGGLRPHTLCGTAAKSFLSF